MDKFFYYAVCLLRCFSIPGFLNIAHAQERDKMMLNYAQCDLQQAMDIAMKNNPELTALECELRAAQARISQAGLLPNPHFLRNQKTFQETGQDLILRKILSVSLNHFFWGEK